MAKLQVLADDAAETADQEDKARGPKKRRKHKQIVEEADLAEGVDGGGGVRVAAGPGSGHNSPPSILSYRAVQSREYYVGFEFHDVVS